MAASVISYLVFFACFGLSFYAISSIQFEKICSVKNPKKVQILMFLLSLCLAYVSSQTILQLTIYNGFA